MAMTKKVLLEKLHELAASWDDGGSVDSYDTGPCSDTALAYVSGCADELRELLAKAVEEKSVLPPTMQKALELALQEGRLTRLDGGFWVPPSFRTRGSRPSSRAILISANTRTVLALEKRGYLRRDPEDERCDRADRILAQR